MAPTEPKAPLPEAFGLTKERIAEFEQRPQQIMGRLTAVAFLVALVWLLSEFLGGNKGISFTLPNVVGLGFVAFIGLCGAFTAALFFFLAGGHVFEAVWKRIQPDYGALCEYEKALVVFKAKHADWLKTQRSWWDRLHPQRFEQEIAAFFKKQGYRVEWTGRSGDGGVDIKILSEGGAHIVVQCKAHEKPVSPGAVRDLYGTLLHEQASEAWLMSRSGFTKGATKFAAGKPIRLLDLDYVFPGLAGGLPKADLFLRKRRSASGRA